MTSFEQTFAKALSEAALEELRVVKDVARFVIQGVRLCALPENRSVIATNLLQGTGFQPGLQQQADTTADELISIAQSLHQDDFVRVLRSSLLNAYSAFEFFFKALYVDYAKKDGVAAIGLSAALKTRVSAQLLLQEDPEERLFLLADEAWQQAASGRSFVKRCLYFISTYCDPDFSVEIEQAFEKHGVFLDQLHDLRVSLTHHGGKPRGAKALNTISRKTATQYLNSLIDCATAVFDATPFPLYKRL